MKAATSLVMLAPEMRALSMGASLAALLLLAAGARAQVNTERLREDAQGLTGGLEGKLSLKTGNSDFLRVDLGLWSQYSFGIHTLLAHTRGALGEQNGERFTRNAFGHLRWTAMWHPVVGSELFSQIAYDEFVRLELRALGGAGVRFVVVNGDQLDVYLGTGWMLEYERLDIPESDPHPRRTLAHRSTSYAAVRLDVSDVIALTEVLYIQPRFDDPEDLRILDEFELEIELDEDTLKLTLTARMRFDSRPPSELEKLDFELENGIEVNW